MTDGYVVPGEFGTGRTYAELCQALDELKDDPKWRHKIIVLPPGSKVESEEGDDDDDDGSGSLVLA